MTKFHNLKYSLIAFIIFSIITPMVLSQAKISDGADFYILYWLFSVLALIPANIAYRKGRDFAIWYVYGLCLWLIALIHALIIKDNDIAKETKGWHKCPYCGEYSRPEATVCHCCGKNLK